MLLYIFLVCCSVYVRRCPLEVFRVVKSVVVKLSQNFWQSGFKTVHLPHLDLKSAPPNKKEKQETFQEPPAGSLQEESL